MSLFIEQNKSLMQKYFEQVWNRGDLVFIDENLATGFVSHDPVLGQPSGREGIKWVVTMFRNAIPDLHFLIEDMIAEGDKVVTRYLSYGTHQGELMGMSPTGKKLTASGIVIDRIDSSSKIVEHWAKRDDLGLLQQLGVIPKQGN